MEEEKGLGKAYKVDVVGNLLRYHDGRTLPLDVVHLLVCALRLQISCSVR